MLHEPQKILIQPFDPTDQDQVKALILAGLEEHWSLLDPSLNHDLDDITSSYAGAAFLVARLDGCLVGTGALRPRSPTTAEIVRMSVAKPYRRVGIGSLLLKHLVRHAQEAGFEQVILETTATWKEVVDFYKGNGFQVTHYDGGDVYFSLELACPSQPG